MEKQNLSTRFAMGLASLILSCTANAADIRDQLDVQTGKAELVIPDMSAQQVAENVKDGLSQWAIPASSNIRSLPSTIPPRPDEPVAVQTYFQGAPLMEYQCKTAYAEITKKPPPVKNAFMFAVEYVQACVYPFQKGVKVYLVFTSAKKTESLTSGLFNGITRAIRGKDSDWMTKQLNENITAIKKNIPSLLVEKIEVPGLPVQEPDKVAVAALIPAKVDKPVIEVQPAPLQTQAMTSPVAPAPNNNQLAAKIEARKNLTAMGLTYHSQEQFISSIRRKDDVAVQLFLDSGGIDPAAKEKNGKTPVEIANDLGAADIAKMIADRIKSATASTSLPIAVAAPSPAPAAAATSPLEAAAAKKQAVDIAAASLPPEILESINAQVNAMNLPPEKKEEMRAQAITNMSTQVAAIKGLVNRIDPDTGALR